MVLILVVILLAVYSLLNRPVFTYISVEKILEFNDELGQLATQTKKVTMRIIFHPKRPVRDARHYLGYGGQAQSEIEKPVVSNNGLSVEVEFKNPKPGSYHTVEWDW